MFLVNNLNLKLSLLCFFILLSVFSFSQNENEIETYEMLKLIYDRPQQQNLIFNQSLDRKSFSESDNYHKKISELEDSASFKNSKIHVRWLTMFEPKAELIAETSSPLKEMSFIKSYGTRLSVYFTPTFQYCPEIFGFSRAREFQEWTRIDTKYQIPKSLSPYFLQLSMCSSSTEKYLELLNQEYNKSTVNLSSSASDESIKQSLIEIYLQTIRSYNPMSLEQYHFIRNNIKEIKEKYSNLWQQFNTLKTLVTTDINKPKNLSSFYMSEPSFWTLQALLHQIGTRSFQLNIDQNVRGHIFEGHFTNNVEGNIKLKGGLHTAEAFSQYKNKIPSNWITSDVTLENGVRRIIFHQNAYHNKSWKMMLRTKIHGNNALGGKTLFPADFSKDDILKSIKHVAEHPMIETKGNQWSKSIIGIYKITSETSHPQEIWIRVDFNPETGKIYSAYPTWQQQRSIVQDLHPKKFNYRQL